MSMPATDLRALFTGPNAAYILDMYDRYVADPDTVDADLRAFFDATDPAALAALAGGTAATTTTTASAPGREVGPAVDVDRVVGIAQLAGAIRDLGHLSVQLDPLGTAPPGSPELDTSHYGLSDADLQAIPASAVGGPAAEGVATAADAIRRLRETYGGSIGFDLDHIQIPEERAWFRDVIENNRYDDLVSADVKKHVLERLTQVEAFETFLHQTYLGQKRFSIEGNDILIPVLDQFISDGAAVGNREVILGMAHRGRLNVLTHILGKPYEAIISAFEGGKGRQSTAPDTLETDDEITGTDATDDVTGDVKYHLGAKLAVDNETGRVTTIPLVLAPNPSHLEAVNPVVVGMTRASQDIRDRPGVPDRDPLASMAILIHGDAAFPGQGVVAETLNLSGLKGYTVGGTIHIIVNNQIGYTTDTEDSRSSLYASDLAKGFEIPIFHVSADDPASCLIAAHIALEYRQRFAKDVLIDLVGYRRWGHNEGDEPTFTQPVMYSKIQKHPTVRKLWAKQLADEGLVSAEKADAMFAERMDSLASLRKSLTEGAVVPPVEPVPSTGRREVKTAISQEQLQAFQRALHALPEGFKPPSKLARQWDRRAKVLDNAQPMIDWALAETLAFAAIISDGTPIRLTGQDAERGTFSQRHLVLHDNATGSPYNPLTRLPEAKASFAVYNSPLSENAAVGFEYGYSVHAPEVLVLWEGQFGDFVNGAQVIIDQFLASSRAKWQQEPALTMLLPHGYEGQGPEHSSARLERFLQLVAFDNMRVANCTTAAQYFHLLRRQAGLLSVDRRPLIIMTPKSLLRHPMASSPLSAFTSGTFQPVLDDARAADRRDDVKRLVLCSGRIWVDLEANEARADAKDVAVGRVEQLAPFQRTALGDVISEYPNLDEIVWVQEEPRNMGAWSFMEPQLRELVDDRIPVRYIGRPKRASPAEGSAEMHNSEQRRIVSTAFDRSHTDGPVTTGNGRRNGKHASRRAQRQPATVGDD